MKEIKGKRRYEVTGPTTPSTSTWLSRWNSDPRLGLHPEALIFDEAPQGRDVNEFFGGSMLRLSACWTCLTGFLERPMRARGKGWLCCE